MILEQSSWKGPNRGVRTVRVSRPRGRLSGVRSRVGMILGVTLLTTAGFGCGGDQPSSSGGTGEALVGQSLPPVPGYEEFPDDVQQARRDFEMGISKGIDARIEFLQQLQATSPGLPFEDEVLSALATSLNIRGRVEDATAVYEQILESHGESVYALEALLYLREVYRSRGDSENLIESSKQMLSHLHSVRKEEPDRSVQDLSFLEIECLLDLGRIGEAKDLALQLKKSCQEADDLLPLYKACVYLVRLHEKEKEYEQALRSAREALDIRKQEDERADVRVVRPHASDLDKTIAEIAESWARSGDAEHAALVKLSEEIDLPDMVDGPEAKTKLAQILKGELDG